MNAPLLRPPAGFPPVLVDRVFADEPAGDLGPAAVTNGRLRLSGGSAGEVVGYPAAPASFRDVVVDTVLTLESGGDGDGYGVFLRQSQSQRYAAVLLSPGGTASVMLLDGGEPLRVAEGPIGGDVPFFRGVGATNRLTVVTCGPCLVPIINGVALTGVLLDRRYVAGVAGFLLVPSGPGEQRTLTAQWIQVRAMLADQT